MTNVATTLRKSIRLMGQEVTLYDRISGAEDAYGDPTFTEDAYGDPTFTFSQVTMTVLLQPKPGSDQDMFTATGRQHEEVNVAFVSADETVGIGDEMYVDASAKRYAIKGVTAVLYRGDIAFYRLYLQEMAHSYTYT